MKLEVGDLVIEPLKFEELSYVKSIRDQSLEYLDTQISFSLKETQDWFKTTSPKWYGIHLRETFIGYIRTSDYLPTNKSLYVGMDLGKDYRGNGYAYQVYLEFMAWLKRQGFVTVFLRVQVRNFRAYNLYRKLGFRPVGVYENFVIAEDGNALDVFVMQKEL
jgi:RimJ/RimL family protein N-acetyltransferase